MGRAVGGESVERGSEGVWVECVSDVAEEIEHGGGVQGDVSLGGGEGGGIDVVEEFEGGGAQQRDDHGCLPQVDGTGVLAERDVAHPVQPVLDVPVGPPAAQQVGG